MSTALNELDYVYKQAAKQINGLISDLHPFIGAEVNRILNVSLTTTHNTMQPAIDVGYQRLFCILRICVFGNLIVFATGVCTLRSSPRST